MKRTFLLLILGLAAVLAQAQSRVHGRVVEYDGTSVQKAVGQVEISVMGAGSAVSDNNGNFVLKFRVLRPGDKIRVNRISKPGYEVFNKDAVESWVIPSENDESFTIVLCSTNKLSQIRQSYQNAAKKHASQHVVNQEKTYKIELKKGRITKSEYDQKVLVLRDEMERRLSNADEFIEKFVHVDVSRLDRQERKILKFIKKGEFEEAMRLYEQENLINKYAQQVAVIDREQQALGQVQVELQKQRQERDSLYATIKRHINLLLIAGGRENNEKVKMLYRTIAYSDTTFCDPMYDYGHYIYGQLQYEDAYDAYSILIRHTGENTDMLLEGMVMKAASARMSKRVSLSKQLLLEALSAIDSLPHKADVHGLAYYHLGQAYASKKQYNEAIDCYMKSKEQYEKAFLADSLNCTYAYNLSRVETFCADAYDCMAQKEEAVAMHMQSLTHIAVAYRLKPMKHIAMYAYAHQMLARVYDDWDSVYFEKAVYHYNMADSMFQVAVKRYPQGYMSFLAFLYVDMGTGYVDHGFAQEGIAWLERAKNLYKEIIACGYRSQESTKEVIEYCNDNIAKAQKSLQRGDLPPE